MQRWLNRRTFLAGIGASLAAPAIMRVVKAQGLVGDGIANDLPVLQSLLDAAEKKGRGTIELPPGIFRLVPKKNHSAMPIPANVNLHGAGKDQTTLLMGEGLRGHVVTARYGWVSISDLTIDGNEKNRVGTVGHNIRIHGDNVRVERVRVINAVTYGIGISQRGYARNVTIRDVEIINAGADGIDVKNMLNRTENILIEKVTVRGFGRPLPGLPPDRIGTDEDRHRNKAGVDLRGHCEVRDLTVIGVLADRDGLRFRQGEVGQGKYTGAGAHGSSASNVTIRGTKGQRNANGIAVYARDVRIDNADVAGMDFGLQVTADRFAMTGGRVSLSTTAPILARANRFGAPANLQFDSVSFENERRFHLQDIERVVFHRCQFSKCRERLRLEQMPGVTLSECEFDASCG